MIPVNDVYLHKKSTDGQFLQVSIMPFVQYSPSYPRTFGKLQPTRKRNQTKNNIHP